MTKCRDTYPALLKKSDRGKNHQVGKVPLAYGEILVSDHVSGVELLQAYEENKLGEDDTNVNEVDDDVGDEGAGSDEIVEEEDDDVDFDNMDENNEEESEGVDDNESDGADVSDEDSDGDNDGDEESDGDDEDEDDEEEDFDLDNTDDKMETGDAQNIEDADSTILKKRKFHETSTSTQNQSKFSSIYNRPDASRFLTQEDFDLLRRLKATQAENSTNHIISLSKKKKSSNSDDEEECEQVSYAVAPESLESRKKIYRSTKIERLKKILEGREDKKFVTGHAGGLTNKEKERQKNYVMVRRGKREVSKKIQRSSSEVRWKKNTAVSTRCKEGILLFYFDICLLENSIWT